MTRPLLVLRPQPGADATARKAASLGMQPVVAPLFAVRAVAWEAPEAASCDALMLTSANAARHAGAQLARFAALRCYCVGAATAAAARAAGITDVIVSEGDASALLSRVAADGVAAVLHLAGREHRAVPAPGIAIERRIVYAAEPVAAFPAPALTALGQGAVALLHSPRAATLFTTLCQAAGIDRHDVAIAALSAQVRDAAGGDWRALAVAPRPDDDALLAAAAPLCDQ